jgi:hypothetical protein
MSDLLVDFSLQESILSAAAAISGFSGYRGF